MMLQASNCDRCRIVAGGARPDGLGPGPGPGPDLGIAKKLVFWRRSGYGPRLFSIKSRHERGSSWPA
ncbi:hypothetical protein BQ8482_330132 [Mesorhizobium delmotii]|uniref:Uncharacterized protein n=1 Tax=Mesorhizobium delmotii TaxID=1631247 RepID=A0A2P9APC2_9HYPH|nr:hypothetical protein BQ8482_330132 [Mesorhizobium delmotii]